jgi:hypothetical protein
MAADSRRFFFIDKQHLQILTVVLPARRRDPLPRLWLADAASLKTLTLTAAYTILNYAAR